MRLLFLCERLPYPATGGSAVRTLALVRALAGDHQVEILAFGDRVPRPLTALCHRAEVVESPGEATVAGWLADDGDSELPWSVRQRSSAAMSAAVAKRSAVADVVVATKLAMAQYLGDVAAGVLRVYDAHDVDSVTLAQVARLQVSPLTRVHAVREAAAVERYERRLGDLADLVMTVTDADCARLRELTSAVPVKTVPIGVVADDYPSLWRHGRPRLAFFGDLGWPPNADAAVHLCRDVLPLLPDHPEVVIAGRRPGRDVRALAGAGVEVAGPVTSMAELLAGDTIAVAPLRAGTGMRVKLLETMAWGLPAVGSSIACAGIDHGGVLVEVDGPRATAAAIGELLADRVRREGIGLHGRELVAERYGHAVSGERLLAAIAAASPAPSSR